MGSSLLLAVDGHPRQNLSIFDPASPSAESIFNSSVLVLAISAFIFLVVEGVLDRPVADVAEMVTRDLFLGLGVRQG